jgi:hypothetical protein
MRAEILQKWQEAMDAFREAELCLGARNHDAAKLKAWREAWLGWEAMDELGYAEEEWC